MRKLVIMREKKKERQSKCLCLYLQLQTDYTQITRHTVVMHAYKKDTTTVKKAKPIG